MEMMEASAAIVRTTEHQHDIYLDWLRGVAALLVLLAHARGGFFVKWSDLDMASQTHINFFLFFVTRLGREAVIIFFILSGYLVGGQAIENRIAGRFSFLRYMLARIARLYTVLVPALLATLMLEYARGTLTTANGGVATFIGNLLFLQSTFVPSYGSNAPLWSLAFEWWFYVMFGLCIFNTTPGSRQIGRAHV